MAWDKGFNFRRTAGFVTDGTNQTYAVGSDTEGYPVTRNSVTFGWSTSPNSIGVDHDNGVDPRFAGVVYVNPTVVDTFRVDLPATGAYDIRVALGDTTNPSTYQYCTLADNDTVFATINDSDGTLADNYDDASGTNRTEAAWPAGNTAVRRTFTSQILKVTIGNASCTGYTTIAHLFVSQVATNLPVFAHHYLQQG